MAKNKKNTKSKSSSKRKGLKKSNFKKAFSVVILLAVIVALAIFGYIQISGVKDQTIVASVNNEKIASKELDRGYDFLFLITGYPEEYKQIITKEAYLDQLINENLLLQEAKEQNFALSNKKVDERLKEMMDQNLLTEEQFEDRLKEGGFSLDYFKEYYKRQLTISDFLNETLFSEIEIADSEIKEYYESNKESYSSQEGQIRARHILVETEKEANEILKEIRKGADFAELAEKRSIGPSSTVGGDLGFFGKGTMIKEFEQAAFGLRIGQVSDPVKTEYGWHIIKREPGVIPYEEAKESIRELLSIEKQKQAFQDYMENLKEDSEIIINLDGAEIPAAVNVDDANAGNTCIDNYDEIADDTVIFYHASWCPHCRNMGPIVEDLEDEGYKFLWAETSSGENTHIVAECFSDVIQGGVPEFICAGTSDYELGEMSKSQLRNFAEKCRG